MLQYLALSSSTHGILLEALEGRLLKLEESMDTVSSVSLASLSREGKLGRLLRMDGDRQREAPGTNPFRRSRNEGERSAPKLDGSQLDVLAGEAKLRISCPSPL